MLSLYFIDAQTIEAAQVDWPVERGHRKCKEIEEETGAAAQFARPSLTYGR